jgi:hypothetical protein
MNTRRRMPLTALLLSISAVCALTAQRPASAGCAGEKFCTETATFLAEVTNFRTSVLGGARQATASVRFQNKTDRPLVLGYAHGSGVVIDDQGNRYIVDTRDIHSVRAIGIVARNSIDPKFTLQPGESSDALFRFSWYPGNQVTGTSYQLELTIREIDPIAGDQHKLGTEHATQFRGLSDGVPTTKANSVDANRFDAQVTQVTTSQAPGAHLVRLTVQFRNVTQDPLILAFTRGSGTLIDENGNTYIIDHRNRSAVTGTGIVDRNNADPQFELAPGQSRTATFEYSRYVGNTAIGSSFTPDLAVESLERLPSKQIRSTRQFSLYFANLTKN